MGVNWRKNDLEFGVVAVGVYPGMCGGDFAPAGILSDF